MNIDNLIMTPLALALYILVFGLIGSAFGQRKGRPFAGFVFGALIGPIGWLVVLLGPDVNSSLLRKCPYCCNDAHQQTEYQHLQYYLETNNPELNRQH